jgi:hypothetical protein
MKLLDEPAISVGANDAPGLRESFRRQPQRACRTITVEYLRSGS